jgi:DNA-directed RNA polymerase subunit N (RpoN/RPB10)
MSIIPPQCIRCSSRDISAKYLPFKQMVAERKKIERGGGDEDGYFVKTDSRPSVEGLVLDELKVHDICCRMHLLTHVDIF